MGEGSNAYLRFKLSVLLVIAILALCDAPWLAVHFVCLLGAGITAIVTVALRLHGVAWLANIGFWLCFVANGVLEHDSRRSVAVAATATISVLACISMLIARAVMKGQREVSEVPENKKEGDRGIFDRWFGE